MHLGQKIWIKFSFKKTHQSNLRRQKKKKKKQKKNIIPELHSSSTVSQSVSQHVVQHDEATRASVFVES
jgi:hypothetical protein